jgi:uncharacterized protein YlxW (UPF0749 family)
MEPMTPEERFTKIENAIYSLTEIQAKHEGAIRDLILASRAVVDSQQGLVDSQQGLVDSQKKTTAQIQALASEISQLRARIDQMREAQQEAQQVTDDKLHALIDTVDRIIRQQNL